MSIHNTYDHSLKILARTYPESFMALAMPNIPVTLVGTLENVELALEIERIDFLHEVLINGERALLHFDFEFKHKTVFPERVHVYHGMLTQLNKPIKIISIPIYLKPRKTSPPDHYKVEVGGIEFHRFTYPSILLWEHIDEIRSGKLYPLAPFLVLITKDASQETLEEERRLIVEHEPDFEKRRTLYRTAIMVALKNQMFDPEFIWSFFKEDNMWMDEDPVLKRWFDEKYGQKLAEARAQANYKAAQAEKKAVEAQQAAVESEEKARHSEQVLREAEAARQAAEREAETARQAAEEARQAAKREAEEARQAAKREADKARQAAERETQEARQAASLAQREAELARHEASLALREAEAAAAALREEQARREAEAARREAEAARREAEATRDWLQATSKLIARRFANTPFELVLDLQRVTAAQHLTVLNLVADAPDFPTFHRELKALPISS